MTPQSRLESSESQIFSLAGRTALVTGAAGHLGRAISRGLAAAGAHVVLNARSAEHVAAYANELREEGLSAECASFDVTDRAAVDRFFQSWPSRLLHAVVNNAYAGGAGTLAGAEGRDYLASYDVAVVGAHNIVQGALEHLKRAAQSGGASVINVASMYGMVSPDQRIYSSGSSTNPPYYGAAKAALLQWTRYAACEFGPLGIRVNAISPGPFPSSSVQQADPEFIRRLSYKVPLGRIGQPEELAGAIVFFASAASSYVSGANLVIDGGWTCW
jgi:NAD(P)-dependent dehydrogenase (short-subunit alcohol dehydrogenase family)